MRYVDFSRLPYSKFTVPHRFVSMEEAITLYRLGKTIGIIDKINGNSAKAYLMNKDTTFTCDIDYLINNCQWVVFE